MDEVNNTQTFQVQKHIPFEMPSEYRKHALEMTRREVGNKIFEILWTNKLPAVVDIDEKIFSDYSGDMLYSEEPDDVFEIRVSITPWPLKKDSFIEKVKIWIKKKVSL